MTFHIASPKTVSQNLQVYKGIVKFGLLFQRKLNSGAISSTKVSVNSTKVSVKVQDVEVARQLFVLS